MSANYSDRYAGSRRRRWNRLSALLAATIIAIILFLLYLWLYPSFLGLLMQLLGFKNIGNSNVVEVDISPDLQLIAIGVIVSLAVVILIKRC